MKNLILLFAFSLQLFAASGSWNGIAFTAWNGIAQTSWNGRSISCASAAIFTETFEANEYDNAGWGDPAGADGNFTTIVLSGAQSYHSTNAVANLGPAFTASSTIYVYFMFRVVGSSDLTSGDSIFTIRDGSGNLSAATYRTSSKFRISNGATFSGDATGPILADTTYYCKYRYTKGSGTDGVSSLEFSTTKTFTGSGSLYKEVTTGTATTDATRIRLESSAGNGQVIDDIAIYTTDQGNFPL